MKNETFTFGSEPFNEWLAKHPDVEKLTIKGHINTDNLEDIDEQLFNSSIKTIEIGTIILKNNDYKTISLDDYAFTFLDEGNPLPRLFKMLANTKHSSIYSISDNLILSEDGKVLVHIEESEETYTIQIPENVKIIGDYACCCIDLEDVYFPNGLQEIGSHAFEGCYNLECIDLPDTVVTLGDSAFCECDISSIKLSANLTEISAHCFENNHLTTFQLPFSVKIIHQYAFLGNPIRKITFNQGLELIERNAFPALCYAKFPASMKGIAVDFYYYPKDERNFERTVPYIEVDGDNPYFWAKNGTLYKRGSDELCLEVPFRCKTEHYKEIPELVIPANLQPKSVILKWNPSFSSFPMSGYIELIQDFTLMNGYQRFDSMNWSVWDYDKINVGDRVCWVKVGYGQIGIVSSGTVTSEPYRSEDWSGKGRITYYVDFIPDVLLNPDTVPILTCQELQSAIPDFDWAKGHSGLVLNDEQARKLDTLWKDFLQRNNELFQEKMQKKRNEQVYIEK